MRRLTVGARHRVRCSRGSWLYPLLDKLRSAGFDFDLNAVPHKA
jgi:hypothetical protein